MEQSVHGYRGHGFIPITVLACQYFNDALMVRRRSKQRQPCGLRFGATHVLFVKLFDILLSALRVQDVLGFGKVLQFVICTCR
jgi:hypothetical protein